MGTITVVKSIVTIELPAMAGKKTADCFVDNSRYWFDRNYLSLLPEVQGAREKAVVSANPFNKNLKLAELVRKYLGIFTLTQAEELTCRQDKGEDVGLLVNSYANFFPLLDREEDVAVLCLGKLKEKWHAHILSSDCDTSWSAGCRFFSFE